MSFCSDMPEERTTSTQNSKFSTMESMGSHDSTLFAAEDDAVFGAMLVKGVVMHNIET